MNPSEGSKSRTNSRYMHFGNKHTPNIHIYTQTPLLYYFHFFLRERYTQYYTFLHNIVYTRTYSGPSGWFRVRASPSCAMMMMPPKFDAVCCGAHTRDVHNNSDSISRTYACWVHIDATTTTVAAAAIIQARAVFGYYARMVPR